MKKLRALVLILGIFYSNQTWSDVPYCAAIRGNGEYLSAHWGAMAHVVENFGLPQGVSGGSSGSISSFLFESVAMNTLLAPEGDERRKRQAAFLIKSFEGYFEMILESKEITTVMELASDEDFLMDVMNLVTELSEEMPEDTEGIDPAEVYLRVMKVYFKYENRIDSVLNSPLVEGMFNLKGLFKFLAGVQESLKNAKNSGPDADEIKQTAEMLFFRIGELKRVVESFWSFDPEKDVNMFFRPALLNFRSLAIRMGRMGSLYALYKMSDGHKGQFKRIIEDCSEWSVGLNWDQIRTEKQNCQSDFVKLAKEYRDHHLTLERIEQGAVGRIKENVGEHLPALISSAVIKGKSALKFRELETEYLATTDVDFGEKFRVAFDDLRYGYWGQKDDLQRAHKNLNNYSGFKDSLGRYFNFSHDAKSKKFYPVGEISWEKMLSLSPAEPGLSKVLLISSNPLMYSSGGWVDPLPTPALKAMGCSRVIYITRKGGEGLFAQGVFKRLLGQSTPSWDFLRGRKNNIGNGRDMNSLWSKFFNLANPVSSFNKSLEAADGIVCTNWSSFNMIGDGPIAILRDAYSAPLYLPEGSDGLSNSNFKYLTSSENTFDEELRYKKYAGCIPLHH